MRLTEIWTAYSEENAQAYSIRKIGVTKQILFTSQIP